MLDETQSAVTKETETTKAPAEVSLLARAEVAVTKEQLREIIVELIKLIELIRAARAPQA